MVHGLYGLWSMACMVYGLWLVWPVLPWALAHPSRDSDGLGRLTRTDLAHTAHTGHTGHTDHTDATRATRTDLARVADGQLVGHLPTPWSVWPVWSVWSISNILAKQKHIHSNSIADISHTTSFYIPPNTVSKVNLSGRLMCCTEKHRGGVHMFRCCCCCWCLHVSAAAAAQ